MRKRKPELLLALEALKQTVDPACPSNAVINTDTVSKLFELCHAANDDVHYSHALYREISEIAIKQKRWRIAEEFAVRTLKLIPGHGAAIKILGRALRGQGRVKDAEVCLRYGLPTSIIQEHFNDSRIKTIESNRATHIQRLPAFSAHSIPITDPVELGGKENWDYQYTKLEAAAANTFLLPEGKLWFDGFNTIIWNRESCIVTDVSRGLPEVVHSAIGKRSPKFLKGSTVILGNRNSDNYYHWMNDILPRICVLERSGIKIDEISQFIINPVRHAFQYETLNTLGIDKSRLIFAEHENYFSCERLLAPTYGSNTLGKGQGAWMPQFLRSRFLPFTVSGTKQKLYISRKHASGRRVENEDALYAYLEKQGFLRIFLEEHTVAEQARLFNGASVILSSHGAGLSNTVFCVPGTTIIELYRDHVLPCFWLTSQLCFLRHAVFYCGVESDSATTINVNSADDHDGSSIQVDDATEKRNSNFTVDINQIDQLLTNLNIS